MNEQRTGHRRIDRIRDPAFIDGVDTLSLDDLRARRDECLAEREYLSLLRRLVQGRAEILRAELDARGFERLVADAGISDPTALDDANLASAVDLLASEEREVSTARSDVIRVLDTLQDELKRRYREDPSLVLS